LRDLYGGGLDLDERCLFTNFVETVDGVVAIPDLPHSNALIAAGSEADRFVMGLLRASADAILVGSGTMRASPTIVFVTAGGSFDPAHPALERSAIILTTRRAEASLKRRVPAASEVVAVNDGERVDLQQAITCLHERGHSLILSEGGPTLFASLLAAGVVDELFLTVSPVLAGRAAHSRLPLVTGVELLPGATDVLRLLSARRHEDHLFLRYSLAPQPSDGPSSPNASKEGRVASPLR